jgi:DNA-binding IclR family transcriptional regulator
VAGITDLGTPVYDHHAGVTAALVIPFLHRLDHKDAQELNESRRALLEAGREISHALGARMDHK